jgi:hypothetical protein
MCGHFGSVNLRQKRLYYIARRHQSEFQLSEDSLHHAQEQANPVPD